MALTWAYFPTITFLALLNCSQTLDFRVADVALCFEWKFHIHLSSKRTSSNIRFMRSENESNSASTVSSSHLPPWCAFCAVCIEGGSRTFCHLVLLTAQFEGPVTERAGVSESLF